ncbi:hypothetical protein BaRGS_00014232 [Batillaria attramentaria]|uniref:Uncharacterized protein n=1 Tax=Batillaria attramentaria TaxID=370345 RepID=A0ABD0L4V3_9CAEN
MDREDCISENHFSRPTSNTAESLLIRDNRLAVVFPGVSTGDERRKALHGYFHGLSECLTMTADTCAARG